MLFSAPASSSPGEGPGGPGSPLIFRLKLSRKGRKHLFGDRPSPLSPPPPLIWRSGSATACSSTFACHLFVADTETPSTPRSPCEKQRVAALQESSDTFVPYCRPDGSFDPIQCQGLMCYCVDSDGKTIEGTDKPRPTRPDCEGRCYNRFSNTLLPFFARLILRAKSLKVLLYWIGFCSRWRRGRRWTFHVYFNRFQCWFLAFFNRHWPYMS